MIQRGEVQVMVQQSWWSRVVEAARWVLALEPVVVQNVVRGVLVLAVAVWGLFGLELDTSTVEPRIVAVVLAVYALAEVLGAIWARRRVTPDVKVVEVVPSLVRDEVAQGVPIVAGKANERVEPGTVVRYLWDDPTE